VTPQPRRSIPYSLARRSARDRHAKTSHSPMRVTSPVAHDRVQPPQWLFHSPTARQSALLGAAALRPASRPKSIPADSQASARATLLQAPGGLALSAFEITAYLRNAQGSGFGLMAAEGEQWSDRAGISTTALMRAMGHIRSMATARYFGFADSERRWAFARADITKRVRLMRFGQGARLARLGGLGDCSQSPSLNDSRV